MKLHLNPKLNKDLILQLQQAVAQQGSDDCTYILSSGTESQKLGMYKLVGLTDHGLRVAAQSVIKKFGITSGDLVLNALPDFHVGGLAVELRAKLACHKVINYQSKWDPQMFAKACFENKITYASLVPTQIYDLVISDIKSPSSLKFIFVGGGSLSNDLKLKAIELGWPLVLTYGMTETSAMISTTEVLSQSSEDKMELLPHVDMKIENQQTYVKSEALFSHYLFVNKTEVKKIDPKLEGWFRLDDEINYDGGFLSVRGRKSELVKIKGETVSLLEIENILKDICLNKKINLDFYLTSRLHPRDENEIVLVSTTSAPEIKKALDIYNQSCLPFQRILNTEQVSHIERTELGKVRR